MSTVLPFTTSEINTDFIQPSQKRKRGEDILAHTTLIIEDFIDLQNPIFQGETGLHEEPNTPIINEGNNNDMDFDLVNLVDDILSSRLE